MLCPRCRTPVPDASELGLGSEGASLEAGRARAGELCVACGALLAPPGMTARLLAKVAQLARFGLAGRTTPLLRGGDPASAGLAGEAGGAGVAGRDGREPGHGERRDR